MPKAGYLIKRGRRFPTWRKRWIVIADRHLKYYLDHGKQQRGEMTLAGGYVRNEPNATFGKPNVAAIVTPDRTLFIQADTADELAEWSEALTMECSGRAVSSRAKPPPPPMPDILDIDGVPETGAELRVRAGGSLLESLCVAWYRVAPGADPPATAADPAKCPGVTMMAGATLQTYTVAGDDVGTRIGCSARPATGDLFVNHTMALAVTAVNPAELAARIRLRPHTHHKYCDRRVRVCTAEGRYREGEVLLLAARGAGLEGYRVQWAISAAVLSPKGKVIISKGAGAGAGGAAASLPDAAAASASASGARGAADEARQRAITQALMQRVVRLTPEQLGALEFAPAPDRPLHAMPATPAAHEPAQPAAVALSPPPAGAPAALAGPPRGAHAFPLRFSDVGCMVRAELHPLRESSGAPVIVSNAVGPIEGGPPRARTIWVEGAPCVGALLLGRWMYFGGHQGSSQVSWVRVSSDGSSAVVKGPSAIDAGAGDPPALATPIRVRTASWPRTRAA